MTPSGIAGPPRRDHALRVRRARRALAGAGVRFAHGGFELGPLGARRAVALRALNVLRQYDEADVPTAWQRLTARLADDGVAVEGTCDEIGRLAAWALLDRSGPRSLVLAYRLAALVTPGAVAARLPKALVHRNVPGEPVHGWLAALDDAWRHEAPLATFGARQRFAAACRRVAAAGWPVRRDPGGRREGVVEVAWHAVAPADG